LIPGVQDRFRSRRQHTQAAGVTFAEDFVSKVKLLHFERLPLKAPGVFIEQGKILVHPPLAPLY
jgi:hypothetical protein